MKRIIIAGKGSYIGESFKHYIENISDEYIVDEIDTFQFDDKKYDFSGVDVVLCVAGIAHRKETSENQSLYYSVNRDLAIQLAKKAKAEGVGQFIFLSSMSVYGQDSGIITPDTVPSPKNSYGDSKYQAEQQIFPMRTEYFRIAILRPPMVYGKNCRGNFQTIVKIIERFPVFPKIKNKRSMIYIDNLCEFIKLCIDKEKDGLFFPQNKQYVDTSKMAEAIAVAKSKKIFFSRILGIGVRLIRPFVSVANKAFGDLIYHDTEKDDFSYCVVDDMESFKRSV